VKAGTRVRLTKLAMSRVTDTQNRSGVVAADSLDAKYVRVRWDGERGTQAWWRGYLIEDLR
jgi:predicted aminopeptidase